MSKVFVNIGLSLDGYMAPEGMAIENWNNPQYKNWGAKWGALMAWLIFDERLAPLDHQGGQPGSAGG